MKKLPGCLLLLVCSLAWASEQDLRLVESMERVRSHYYRKNWVMMLQEAYRLYSWGEVDVLSRVLKMSGEVALMRNSDAAALQVAALYKKISAHQESRYWLKTAERLRRERLKRWKKY